MKKLFLTISLIALVGCNTTTYPPNAAVPAGWTANATVNDAVLQQRWWEQFNDPILNQLIRTADAQNLDLKIAATRVRAARAQLLSVEASYLPNITGAGSVSRARTSSKTVRGQAAGFTGNLYDVEADATWEFNIFSISPTIEAAKATIKSVQENQNGVLLSLLGEVANNYIQLRLAQQSLALTDQTITAYQTALDLASAREKVGLVSGLDTSRAQSALETQKAQRPVITAQITAAIRRMEVLLGQNPGMLDAQLTPPAAIPVANSPLLLATPAAVIANRPDVRAAEQNLRANNATKRVATAEYFPSISLPAAFGWQAARPKDMLSGGSLLWSLTAGAAAPIFDFGRIQSNIDLADANAQQAFFQYQQSVQGALSDVETALSDYLSSVNRAPQLERAVAADQTTLQLSQERYDRGLTNYLDVTTAQQALYAEQQAQLQNQSDMAARLVTLYKTMGGGWQGESNTTPITAPTAVNVSTNDGALTAPVSQSVQSSGPVVPPTASSGVNSAPAPAPNMAVLPTDIRSNAPHVKTDTNQNKPVMVIE